MTPAYVPTWSVTVQFQGEDLQVTRRAMTAANAVKKVKAALSHISTYIEVPEELVVHADADALSDITIDEMEAVVRDEFEMAAGEELHSKVYA